MTGFASFTKDPDAVLTYTFDWSDWLGAGETIASYVITAETGLTVVSDSNTTTTVIVNVSGGAVGESLDLACRITTNASPAQTDERTITLNIAER